MHPLPCPTSYPSCSFLQKKWFSSVWSASFLHFSYVFIHICICARNRKYCMDSENDTTL